MKYVKIEGSKIIKKENGVIPSHSSGIVLPGDVLLETQHHTTDEQLYNILCPTQGKEMLEEGQHDRYVAGQGILLLSMTPVPLVVERKGAQRSSPATFLGQVNAYAAAHEPHMKCQHHGHILSCTRGIKLPDCK